MRRTLLFITLALVSASPVVGQTSAGGQQSRTMPAGPPERPFTDGPVWRITYMRTKPGKGPDHMRWLREYRKRILDEQKAQGLIADYKHFVKPTTEGPNDWDIAEALMFRSYGDALDFNEERSRKTNDITLKVFGSAENRAKLWAELRDASRDVHASHIVREVMLKPMSAPPPSSGQ